MIYTPHPDGLEEIRPEEGPRPSDLDERLAELEEPPVWTARAGRHGFREKLGASLSGLKHAVRGDSSFFAHGYRFLLIALTAAMLGVDPLGWCLLAFSAALVFIAELTNSSIDTLARALGDPEEPRLRVAREIATGGVLVAVTTWAAISITVLVLKLGVLLAWWG